MHPDIVLIGAMVTTAVMVTKYKKGAPHTGPLSGPAVRGHPGTERIHACLSAVDTGTADQGFRVGYPHRRHRSIPGPQLNSPLSEAAGSGPENLDAVNVSRETLTRGQPDRRAQGAVGEAS